MPACIPRMRLADALHAGSASRSILHGPSPHETMNLTWSTLGREPRPSFSMERLACSRPTFFLAVLVFPLFEMQKHRLAPGKIIALIPNDVLEQHIT